MRPHAFLQIDAACVLFALAGGAALSGESRAATETLRDGDVTVRRGGVRWAARSMPGAPVSASDAPAAAALHALVRARGLLPAPLRVPVVLELDPVSLGHAPFAGAEASPRGTVLFVDSARAPAFDRTVWLHELAHLAAAGARPEGPLGVRLLAAVDEAVADYAAATFSRSTLVGSVAGGERRDLAAPPQVGDSEWAYLGLAGAPWDAHRVGWALAGALFEEGATEDVAVDLVQSLATAGPFGGDDTPHGVLVQWMVRCPARSRPALRRAVGRWIPSDLFLPEDPA